MDGSCASLSLVLRAAEMLQPHGFFLFSCLSYVLSRLFSGSLGFSPVQFFSFASGISLRFCLHLLCLLSFTLCLASFVGIPAVLLFCLLPWYPCFALHGCMAACLPQCLHYHVIFYCFICLSSTSPGRLFYSVFSSFSFLFFVFSFVGYGYEHDTRICSLGFIVLFPGL